MEDVRAGGGAPPPPELDEVANDWVDRVFARAPVPPWALGVGIGAALLAAYVSAAAFTGDLARFLAGDLPWFADRNARLGVTLPFLVAYFPTAQRYLALAAHRNLTALKLFTGAASPTPRRLPGRKLAMALALVFTPITALVVDRDTLLYFEASYWSGATVGNWTLGLLFCAGFARLGHATLSWSRTFSAAAEGPQQVDLFDRTWLEPFARQGLLCALLWLLVPALFAVNVGDAPFALMALPLLAVCIALGTTALWLPTSGVRRRLVDTRDAELSRVHRGLRGDAEALSQLAVGRRPAELSLADLLAYERFLRDLPTSPFDQANWIRFALYLALPLGSWLGGALVERALGNLLD